MIPKYYVAPKEPVKVYRDGREVCDLTTASGKREYRDRIALMLARQKGLCCLCSAPLRLSEATFEHQDGRGHGGGHRDDRTEKDGHPYNGAACYSCNGAKGSKRIDYHSAV